MTKKGSDDNLFEIMRTQMGLDPKTCDPEMIDSLRKKFYGRGPPVEGVVISSEKKKVKKTKNKDEKLAKFAEKVDKKDDDVDAWHMTSGAGNLELGDIFANLDKSDGKAVNTTKLKKQLKALSKDDQARTVTKQMSGIKKQRLMREQAQELNAKLVSKYIPQVKKEREDQQHDFTTSDKLRYGGGVTLQSVGQMAGNVTEATADSEMEKKI